MATRPPRLPRKQPTHAWGRFLAAKRVERGWTQKQAFAFFSANYPDAFDWRGESVTAYGNLERGPNDPDAKKQAAFLTEFGLATIPDEYLDDSQSAEEMTLVAAIRAQTDAISELAAQVKALVDRPGQDEALVNAVSGAVALAVRTTLQAAGIAPELRGQ